MEIADAFNNELLPYALIAIAVAIFCHLYFSNPPTPVKPEQKEEEEEEIAPPRAFTIAQLRKFDGVISETTPKFDLDAGKIHIAIKGNVYDVTSAANFYGPDGPYHVFAGRDASRALARLSFDEETLANPRIDDLGAAELDQLNDWIEKFEMKRYRVVGRLVTPPESKLFSLEELRRYDGTEKEIEKGRVDPLLYIGCKGKVFDVTFGGFEMYKPGSSYHRFAGKDVSRALAKMSFEPSDIDSRDLSDLTPEQMKVLDDWADKFENKKLYPVVGTLPPY